MPVHKYSPWTLPNTEGYFLCSLGKNKLVITHGPFKTVEDFEKFVKALKKKGGKLGAK